MKIWIITYNDDAGVRTEVFNSSDTANDTAEDWINEYRRDYPDLPEDWREAFDVLCGQLGFMDGISIAEHDICSPQPTELDKVFQHNVPNLSDGSIEVDHNAVVSYGEDEGAYVQSWIWVPWSHIDEEMALITEDGTVWYFDLFEEFMKAWKEAPETAFYGFGTPELKAKSEGVNDAEEFIERNNR